MASGTAIKNDSRCWGGLRRVILETAMRNKSSGTSNCTVLMEWVLRSEMLPFSRSQEREADDLGLIYSAKAGYDPRHLFDLAENEKQERQKMQFLSTHPDSGKNRIPAVTHALL